MSRIEELTAKYRTISYDLERMRSMHCSEVEKAANAEREMNLNKSKLAYVHGLTLADFSDISGGTVHHLGIYKLRKIYRNKLL